MELPEKNPKLKRALTLPLLTFYGLGNILGAGIYVLVGEVAGRAGMFTPFAFILAAIIGALTAVTYAEMSSRYPKSAGSAIYVDEAFHRQSLSTITGLLAATIALISSATLVEGFTGYFQLFVPIEAWIIQIAIVFAVTLVASYGIEASAKLATAITLTETFGLLFIIWIGRNAFTHLPTRIGELMPTVAGMEGILLGSFVAFFAFIGFEDMVTVAEEVQNPKKNMPLAIFASMGIATLLYVLVTVVAVFSLSHAELANNGTPLATIYSSVTGNAPTLITIISLFAIINGVLVQVIMAARVFYGMAQNGWLPSIFGSVNTVTRTPLVATLFASAVVLLFALALPLGHLAELTSFAILLIFAFIHIALIYVKLRYKAKEEEMTFPLWIPVVGCATCVAILLFRIAMII